MFCLNCGTQLSDGEQFCPQCGTPVESSLQDPEKPDAITEASAPDSEPESSPEKETPDENEKTAQSETVDAAETAESAPRLYQESVPAPEPAANNAQPPAEQILASPIYQNPAPPQYQQQYQQPAGQPQYWQGQNPPNTYPAPAAAIPVIPPFMKRKQYFNSAAPEKVKKKADLLSFFTGMGFGALLFLMIVFLLMLLDVIYTKSGYYNHESVIFDMTDSDIDAMQITSIVGLSVSAVFCILCILGAGTKHFGYYIALLLPSLCLTAGTVILFLDFTESHSLVFELSTMNGFSSIMLLVVSVIACFALFASIYCLALSIIVSSSYKNAQKEYIWKATNGNMQ